MFSLMDYKNENRSRNLLVILSGVAAFLDTLFGCVINLALDPQRGVERLFGISLLLALPMYLLDLRSKNRVAFFLLALFLFRWAIRIFLGPTPAFGNPIDWPEGIQLFLSFALLQWHKLRDASA